VAGDLVPDVTRRTFLGGLAVVAAVVATTSPAQALIPRPAAQTPVIILRRREDLLRLVITPINATVDKATGRVTPSGDTGILLVSFGPQSVVERAVANGAPAGAAPKEARLAGRSQLSFYIESPVSLTLASLLSWADRDQVLSEVGRYLDGEALPSDVSPGKGPNPLATQIEMPWWLVLSPNRVSSWTEQLQAKTRNGRSEVFHTRLGSALPGSPQTEDEDYRTVRAVWLRDPQGASLVSNPNQVIAEGQSGHPWSMIPTPRDRADLVRLSMKTGSDEYGGRARAIKARLALSPLGGQLVAEGTWDEPGVSSLSSWQQRIWQGRDTYAKVVRRGFLYPWGFKAAEITEGVRVFRADSSGTIRAFWEKRVSIALTEPTIDLGGTGAATDAAKRGALFSEVTCLTVQTPPLAPVANATPINGQWAGMKVYTPRIRTRNGTSAFPFDLVGIDSDGNEVSFSQPLLFAQQKVAGPRAVRNSEGRFSPRDVLDPNFSEAGAAELRAYYDSSVPSTDKAADFAGSSVSYAKNASKSTDADDGDLLLEGDASAATTMPTSQIVFGITNSLPGLPGVEGMEDELRILQEDLESLLEEFQPNNFPIISEARVFLEDTSRMAQQTIAAALNYPRQYLENAFDEAKNSAQVYMQQAEGAANEFLMDAAKAGGLVTPNLNVAGLSRTLGNVYGDAMAVKGMFDDGRITPGEAFKALELLGGVSLADLIPNPYPGVGADGKPTGAALKIESTFVDTGLDTERLVVTMSMDMAAAGESGDGVLESIPLISVDKARLVVALESVVPTVSGSASWSVRGEFTDFVVHLVPFDGLQFVDVDVARIVFTAGSGKSTNVDVDVREVDFGGLLSLLKTLAAYLPFGDMLVIDVDSSGIEASFSVELPTIALGAFAISGISVGAELGIPFSSGPVRFGFLMSKPEDPFSLTVSGLGGGGWLEQSLGLKGIERLSIAGFLEASIKVDFGVASGGVTARAGFQFAIGPPEPAVDGVDEALSLTAFASLNGNIDVLGIASTSIDVYVGLSVIVPTDLPDYAKLHGIATCTLRVSVAFFSESVTFEVERTMKAAYIDPGSLGRRARSAGEIPVATFRDAWSSEAWGQYCGAFG